jgi:hypothetical protein
MSQKPAVVVTDPHHVRETFTNTLIAFGQMEGVVHLTFGVQRYVPSASTGELEQAREVVCRLVLTPATFEMLHGAVTQMRSAMIAEANARLNGNAADAPR